MAQKRSESLSGDTSTVPVGVARRKDSTWLHHEPFLWWFLPWMSAAIAPPTVTWRVPGVTGTK